MVPGRTGPGRVVPGRVVLDPRPTGSTEGKTSDIVATGPTVGTRSVRGPGTPRGGMRSHGEILSAVVVILLEIFEEAGPGRLPCEQLPGDGGGPAVQGDEVGGAGMAVLRVAVHRWSSGDDDRELPDIMEDCMAELRTVAGGDWAFPSSPGGAAPDAVRTSPPGGAASTREEGGTPGHRVPVGTCGVEVVPTEWASGRAGPLGNHDTADRNPPALTSRIVQAAEVKPKGGR